MKELHAKVLKRAVDLAGGTDKLAERLGVSHPRLALWIQEKATLPPDVFEKLLDMLLDADVAHLGGAKAAAKPPLRVLVVDDDLSGAYGLAHAIKQMGYPVETATDGPSAIELARRFRPDIVFLDLRLPGMDGIEIAQVLKAEGLGTHIIAATLFGSDEERRRTAAAGFQAHMVKPIDSDSLKKLFNALH